MTELKITQAYLTRLSELVDDIVEASKSLKWSNHAFLLSKINQLEGYVGVWKQDIKLKD